MKIKKINIKNIRSYENHEIVFPEGSLLLAGDVGSGKTSILLAIEYALFGLQPGQTGSALLRNNANLGEVSLELELDGNNIVIERKLKRGKTVTNEYSAITLNGEKIECSITELKAKIISLLNYPPEFIKKNNLLYRYTVYTPQEHMKQIILEDPNVRLNILRHIFGIDKYKIIRENLIILINKIKEDSKILQGETLSLDIDKSFLESKKNQVLSTNQKIQDQTNIFQEQVKKRKLAELEVLDLEEKIKSREKLEIELEKAKVLLASKKDNLASIQREYLEIEKSLSDDKGLFNESELIGIIQKLDLNSRESENIQSTYIDSLSQINSMRERKSESLIKKERIFKIDICPTCLQDVPEVHKHNIMNETEQIISSLSKNIELLEKKTSDLTLKRERLKSEKQELEDRKVKLQILKSRLPDIEKEKKRLIDIGKHRESLEKDVLLLTSHIDNLKESILTYSRFNTLFKVKQDELKKAFLTEKNAEIFLAELKKELELTHKEISLLEEAIKSKEEKKKRLSDLLELTGWLSTQFTSLINFTERSVMLNLRNEFSKLFSKWFRMLVHEGFEVNLDENFTPIISQSDIEMDYSFLSGGERTAVALAYRLALNQTINSVFTSIKTRDLVILDEPTEGFSEAQIDKIRDILQELNVKQLIIVSHEQKVEGFVDKIIKIKKEGGVSVTDTPPQT